MSMINHIQNRIRELDGARFQKLADAYLHKVGYERINPIGSVIGTDKVRKGTPDTLIALSNGKYVFAEHTTTSDTAVFKKLKSDLAKCLNPKKTGVPIEKIEEVVFCHTSYLSAQQENALAEECQQRGINLNIFGIGPLSYDLYQKYPGLAREFLSVEVATGQIVTSDEFVTAYNKNKLATRLDTTFHFREKEVEQASQGLEVRDLVIVTGRPGVGKSRLALECCERFTEAHPEYEIHCIFHRGPDLYEDLRVHFSEPGYFLIFVDDANRVNRFEYVVQLLQHQRNDQQIKVIATVRDYALDQVQKAARPHGGTVTVTVHPFNEEQITQLVEDECEIHHHIYLERIADIANGNPRLAIMAAELAKQVEGLAGIVNVSALYDAYFASIRTDLEDLGKQDLIKVAGIVAFFRAVDHTNEEMMRSISEAFEISSASLWDAARRLHELEVLDMYEDEVVRISDQVLATYLFYIAFLKEQVLDFEVLLDRFFPKFRHRLIDAMNPVLSAFYSDRLIGALQTKVASVWQSRRESGDSDGLLHFADVFWFLNETETLLYVSDRISDLDQEAVELPQGRIGTNASIQSPSILSILGSFASAEENTLRVALELLLQYLDKRPSDLSSVLHLLTDRFGFKHTSQYQGFVVQRAVLDELSKRVREGRNELFSRLFLAVAEKYLNSRFSTHEPKGQHTVRIINFELQSTPELGWLREAVWSVMFRLYDAPTLQNEVLRILQAYNNFGYGLSDPAIVNQDAMAILPFIKSKLDQDNHRHCSLVHDYLDLLDKHNIAFDHDLRERFTNAIYIVSTLLLSDPFERRHLELSYEEFRQHKKRLIQEHFATYKFEDYEQLLAHCSVIREHSDDQVHFQLADGFSEVLVALAERDSNLYGKVLARYLELGDPIGLRSICTIERLLETHGVARSYEILSQPDYPTKHRWLFGYHRCLPGEEVNATHLSQIYTIYEESSRWEIPFDFDFLLKYRFLDGNVVARVTAILMQRSEADASFAGAVSALFNPQAQANKVILDLFSSSFDLLKRAYLANLRVNENDDYDRGTLARIMERDPDYIIEYIDFMFETKSRPSQFEDHHNYSFVWMRDDGQELMARVAERIYEHEQDQITLGSSYLNTFFEQQDENSSEIREKQDRLLSALIERRSNDPEFMQFIFNVIARLAPERRRRLLGLFLEQNKSLEAFQRLSLQPTSYSWTGSAVPVLYERAGYLESILPLLNSASLLAHKQYVDQEIQYIRLLIEDHKKKDFIRD